ncbi:MAG TPA: hypothetical protein VK459_14325 [Polyangiaceae bacterium]|nr:hypothetical protein [Polyangiaceae bacterium]
MAYELLPLMSYVRFYLTVVTQLRSACEQVERAHKAAGEAIAPFTEPLAPVRSPALAAAAGAPHTFGAALGDLWKPEDLEGLTGLTDIYEVVGRFSFQGEENVNLARVQQIVAGARNEIAAQRAMVAELAKLPEVAREAAGRIGAEETARAEALRAEKSAAFGPLAEAVRARARQTLEAVKAVPIPDLSNTELAADEYRKYVVKLDQVYQTCLPFLRKAIATLFSFVSAEPPASWPDALPLVREMPPELVTVPPVDSAELTQARATLLALNEEEMNLGRARDEIATALARLEGEVAAHLTKDSELEAEIATATGVIDFVTATEQAEAARQTIAALEQQKTERVRMAGEVWQKHQQTDAAIKVLEEELRNRSQEMAQLNDRLTAERKDEPVLFGKDEWRARVAGLEGQLEGLRTAYNQRLGLLNQFKIDLSAISVQVQTEQAQGGLVDRQLTDTHAKLEAFVRGGRELGVKLGAARPARAVPLGDAQQAFAELQQARLEVAGRVERLRGEMRRQKEENVRVLTRLKQIGVERQQFQGMLQNAQVAVTQGREEALRQLALQRRSAVERHVGEVLSGLERSLASVDSVFIDPARDALLRSTEPRTELAAGVLDHAEKAAPVVAALARELDPDLAAQDATLGQIQVEFCDMAAAACKAAWA